MDEVDYGATAKEEVYREDKIVVVPLPRRRCTPTAKTPLLIVYALVNRPYMVDLQDDRSLVSATCSTLGEDVYLIDWGYPDRVRSLPDARRLHQRLHRAAASTCVAKTHGVDKINLLGICQGGAFSLCFAAIYPHKVQNLITMVTPVDFHTADNMLSHWTREARHRPVRRHARQRAGET